MRCMPLATEGGASIWMTRSTAPMSMPSSSVEVAQRALDLAGLELLLDDGALGGGERAVVGAGDRFSGQFVERAGQTLGDLAAVDEEDCGVSFANDFEQARDESRSRWRRGLASGEAGPLGVSSIASEARHVFNWNFNAQLELFGCAGVDDGDGAIAKQRSFDDDRGPGMPESRGRLRSRLHGLGLSLTLHVFGIDMRRSLFSGDPKLLRICIRR